jgi:hypothetical protein
MDEQEASKGMVPRENSRLENLTTEQLIRLANKTSRRSFIALVGRGGLALMGGSFLALWNAESASAACGSKSHDPTPRISCLCTELIGSNTCPVCCGGFWIACPTNQNDPANCCSVCPNQQIACKQVKLYDCCNACNTGCERNHPNCNPNFGNNTCCSAGYCGDGCDGKQVKCVRKVCLTSQCTFC